MPSNSHGFVLYAFPQSIVEVDAAGGGKQYLLAIKGAVETVADMCQVLSICTETLRNIYQ
jgi:hypothetical protein